MSTDLPLRWHRTTLDGRVATYGETGTGPPVVLLHGWGLTSRAYAAMLPQIARAGARVIAPALPGFGRSDALDGAYTFEKVARWVRDLLDHADVREPAFFIGHSFGGGVATSTAWHFPELVRSLVLVNSVGGQVWSHEEGPDGTVASRDLADRPLWDWGLGLPREFLRRGYRTALPVVARDFVTNAVRNPRALARAAHLARTADLRDELRALGERGLPITVLWGDQDVVIPEAAVVAMCEAAGAKAEVIGDASHSWLLANPSSFADWMTNSLVVHAMLTRDAERAAPRSP